SAAPDAESTDHDAPDIAPCSNTESADPEPGEVLRGSNTEDPDAGPLDSLRTRERNPQRQSANDTPRRLVRSPDSDIDAVHSFEIPVPEIEANTAHEARVADAQASVVDGEVEALGASERGNDESRERHNTQSHGRARLGKRDRVSIPTLTRTRGFAHAQSEKAKGADFRSPFSFRTPAAARACPYGRTTST